MEPNWEWNYAGADLIEAVTELGHPAELGELIAHHLGSPKAIRRMTAYLQYERPTSAEVIVDEMQAISTEIDAWQEKKASEKANGVINEMRCRIHRFVYSLICCFSRVYHL